MVSFIKQRYIIPIVFLMMVLYSCQDAGKNSTGSEFMPEMYHSIAFEANTYNYYPRNTFGTEEEYYQYALPRTPVKGTVSRGSAVSDNHPYYYGASEDERTRAMKDIINNPFPISEKSLEKGKRLFTIYCAICHGDNGDSKGYLVREDGGKYLALPANFMSDDLMNSSNGRFYHAIMRGKNTMEPFLDKLSYEERWQVIQYIRSLQAKSKNLEYNHLENTLNTTDMPGGEIVEEVETVITDEATKSGAAADESHGSH
jgi:mono/diheme cytochrome c family protein